MVCQLTVLFIDWESWVCTWLSLSLLWVFLLFFQIQYLCICVLYKCAFVCMLIYVYALCSLEHMSCLCLVRPWSDVYEKASPSGKWSMVNKVLYKQKHAKCKYKSALVSCVGPIWHQCIPIPSVSPQLLSCWKKKIQMSGKWMCHQWLHGLYYSSISRWDSDSLRETVC